MAERPTYPGLPSGGSTPLTVAATTGTAAESLSLVTLPDPTPAGGDGSYTYAWTWSSRPAGAAATFSNAAIAQPTVTGDVPGMWPAICTVSDGAGQSTEFPHLIVYGVGDGGEYELARLVDFQSLAAQNLLTGGDGNKSIDGDTWTLSTSAGLTSLDITQTAGIGLEWVLPNSSASAGLIVPLTSLITSYDWESEYIFLIRAKLVSGFNGYLAVMTWSVFGSSSLTSGRGGIQWREEGSGDRIGPHRGNGAATWRDMQAITIPADGIMAIRLRGAHLDVYGNSYSTDAIPVLDDLTHIGGSADGDSILGAVQTMGAAFPGWTPGAEHFGMQSYSGSAGAYQLRIPWIAVLKRRVV